ncbi:hypothetical protein NHX12_012437 [Muraenolepis orangiensis]|uniref:Uncharacterized protein n=1 Tax=Muraenolepis orangiensis TaxID=630683 RepID=A0A9Q0DCH3_9TELE|nr:hypothetical protein NHX12_012437 [Muraenolepis orangiensis]
MQRCSVGSHSMLCYDFKLTTKIRQDHHESTTEKRNNSPKIMTCLSALPWSESHRNPLLSSDMLPLLQVLRSEMRRDVGVVHACLPLQMARAGFVHCPSENEPDVACCFYCLLELEGWEPHDDPRIEHTKLSTNCRFLTMGKDFSELTVAEFHHMEKERLKIYIKKASNMKMAYLRDDMDKALDNLNSMRDLQL